MSNFLGIDWEQHYRNTRMASEEYDKKMREGYIGALALKGLPESLVEKLLPKMDSVEDTINRFVSLSRQIDLAVKLREMYSDVEISLESLMNYSVEIVEGLGVMSINDNSGSKALFLYVENREDSPYEYSVIYTPKIPRQQFQIVRFTYLKGHYEDNREDRSLTSYSEVNLDSAEGLEIAMASIVLLLGEHFAEKPKEKQFSLQEALDCLPPSAAITDSSSTSSGLA